MAHPICTFPGCKTQVTYRAPNGRCKLHREPVPAKLPEPRVEIDPEHQRPAERIRARIARGRELLEALRELDTVDLGEMAALADKARGYLQAFRSMDDTIDSLNRIIDEE